MVIAGQERSNAGFAATVPGAERLVVPRSTRFMGRQRWAGVALRCAGPLTLLALWWGASSAGWVSEQTLASPAQVGAAFWRLASSGELWRNLSASLQRALTGLTCGVAIGLVLGVVAGLHRLGDELVDPLLQMLRTIPFLALAPLLIVWFGIGEASKVILISIATAMPMYLNTHSGVRNTDAKILEAARIFGLRGGRLVGEIVLPGALPSLLVGFRLSLGISLLALIVVEQFNAPRGIGFLMTSAQQFFQTDVLVACILIYAVWGLLADLTVRLLERVLMPWTGSAPGRSRAAERSAVVRSAA